MAQIEEPAMSETKDKPADHSDDAFILLMNQRLDRSVINEEPERTAGEADTKFINGEQWDKNVIEQRGKNRLTVTMNKMGTSLDQIDGDIRLSTPGIKVKAVDDDSDPDTADVIEGLIRYVQRNSKARKVHSYAGLHAAAGGRGAWRVLTKYVSDDSFRQEIIIKRITDPYSVYYGVGAEDDDKQDGQYFFIMAAISGEEYKEKYKHEPIDFERDGKKLAANWQSEGLVRVAEYFYKEKIGEKKIHQFEDGTVVEDSEDIDKNLIKDTRTVATYKIKWAKVDGKRVLERGDIPGNMFPVVLTWGKQLCVSGKLEVRGIARHAKDAVRLENYFWSNEAEALALQPKQPYMMPDVCMTDDYRKIWDKANDENYPYLPYKYNKDHPNAKPHREVRALAGAGNQNMIMMLAEAQRDTIGIQKAALGKESNETSGVAIQRRKQESDTGQFAYIDNLSDAQVTEARIILGMIPEIFDYETQLKILGKDMKEKVITVNDQIAKDGNKPINLTIGKYDIDITAEGSYSTQREEFQEKLAVLLPLIPPEHIAMIDDLLFEMQDFHRADDIAARLKKLLPPELQESEDDMDENNPGSPEQMVDENGNPIVEEDPAMIAEQQAQQQAMELQNIELEMAQIKRDQEQAKLDGLRLENDRKKELSKEAIQALIRELIKEGKAPNEIS